MIPMMKGPFTCVAIPGSRNDPHVHYRISGASDGRIATCYDQGSAESLVNYLNSIEQRDALIRDVLIPALSHVMEDDGLIPRATSECRKVVAKALAAARKVGT